MKDRVNEWFVREIVTPWNEDPEVRVGAVFVAFLYLLLGALLLGS